MLLILVVDVGIIALLLNSLHGMLEDGSDIIRRDINDRLGKSELLGLQSIVPVSFRCLVGVEQKLDVGNGSVD